MGFWREVLHSAKMQCCSWAMHACQIVSANPQVVAQVADSLRPGRPFLAPASPPGARTASPADSTPRARRDSQDEIRDRQDPSTQFEMRVLRGLRTTMDHGTPRCLRKTRCQPASHLICPPLSQQQWLSSPPPSRPPPTANRNRTQHPARMTPSRRRRAHRSQQALSFTPQRQPCIHES